MKHSARITRLFGIDVYVHATFPLLFVWIVANGLRDGMSAEALVATVMITLAVFVVVVLHELGHAAAAARFGIRTADITLLPIGGLARLDSQPREPRQELLIAVAGPAVNVALAAIFAVALAASGRLDAIRATASEGASLAPAAMLAQLVAVNLWLAAFNLLPAFPLDGGRALRALLAIRSRDYVKATVSASRVGRSFALLFGLLATFVLGSVFLAAVAVFVWVAGRNEATTVRTAAALEGVPLEHLLLTDVRTLAPGDRLARAARLTIDGFQQDFPVVEDGIVVGMLTRDDLVRGLGERGHDATVESVMRRRYPLAAVDDPAESALERLDTMGTAALPVLRGVELAGFLTRENVDEFVTLRGADRSALDALPRTC